MTRVASRRASQSLDRRRRPELREFVASHHSTEHWADGVLATVLET